MGTTLLGRSSEGPVDLTLGVPRFGLGRRRPSLRLAKVRSEATCRSGAKTAAPDMPARRNQAVSYHEGEARGVGGHLKGEQIRCQVGAEDCAYSELACARAITSARIGPSRRRNAGIVMPSSSSRSANAPSTLPSWCALDDGYPPYCRRSPPDASRPACAACCRPSQSR
jgi:hypothetical protein